MQIVIGLFLGAPVEAKTPEINRVEYVAVVSDSIETKEITQIKTPYRVVPFYSQFNDITSPKWKKVGCGIASLAMIISFHNQEAINVDSLLGEGISSGAFLDGAGWIHAGLISLSEKYGLSGNAYDFSGLKMEGAVDKLSEALETGPVIASVRYKFEPSNPIPHLVVINSIIGDMVYYNDPAEDTGGGVISLDKFKASWKKRFILIN